MSFQIPGSSEEPEESTSPPFSLLSPTPTPSESQDPEEPTPASPSTPLESQDPTSPSTPPESEKPDTPGESTCPLMEASIVTMSATLIIAQPTTLTEMRTILKTVERTKTVDRMVTQTETESVTATQTETETVPATGGRWVQVIESNSARASRKVGDRFRL